jgi:hypothetical protein
MVEGTCDCTDGDVEIRGDFEVDVDLVRFSIGDIYEWSDKAIILRETTHVRTGYLQGRQRKRK